jgi:kynurenine formamidase
MKLTLEKDGQRYSFQTEKGIDLSISLNPNGPRAWYVEPMRIEPVRTEQFLGSVAEGGAVNFRDVYFNPHGHGTHTENVGHIIDTDFPVVKSISSSHFFANLISVELKNEAEDWVVSEESLEGFNLNVEALIIRTKPNDRSKTNRQYSGTNFPYLTIGAMQRIVDSGVQHLLIDLPSVDREEDGGALAAHHLFWNVPSEPNVQKTITELIYVPNEIADGSYVLNLQVSNFANDAAPSRPMLFVLAAE